MDKFVVSARKYRPQNFSTVVGQEHITTTLKNAIIHNQLAHAFLFCGPRGVGKTTCARILAKTINCENRTPEGEACDKCQSCISFNEGTSMNIHELDAASNNSVDDIRVLVEQVRFAPQAGKYKVYIVDEVHMLSTSAFNAFLKTLEEPPPFAIFILATTEKHKILPTILSRCQIFDFKRITSNDTVNHLQEIAEKESISAEKPALQLIAQKSEGCMRDALSILDKIVSFTNGAVTYQNTLEHLNILDEEYYFKLISFLQDQNLADAFLLYDEINKKGFEGDIVLNGFSEFIRNLMVSKDSKAAILLDVVEGMHQRYEQQAQQSDLSWLISSLNILNEAEIQFKMARNKRLHVEMCLIKLCYLQQAIELASDDGKEIIKKKRISEPVAYRTKKIPSFSLKKKANSEEATLIIETERQPDASAMTAKENTVKEPVPSYTPISKETTANAPGQKKSLLETLKEKHLSNTTEIKESAVIPLEQSLLQSTWNEYAESCRSKQLMHVANSFDNARLSIIDNETIVVYCLSTLNQKLIEQEKVDLLLLVQEKFNNKKIQIKYQTENSNTEPQSISPKNWSTQQKFEAIALQYPLVRELKDRLKLTLNF